MMALVAVLSLTASPDGGMTVGHRDLAVRILSKRPGHTDVIMGSGLVVRSGAQMVVATCFHVVQHAAQVLVEVPWRNISVPVRKIVTLPGNDLAFLLVELPWVPSESWVPVEPHVDDMVQVLGFGHGGGWELSPSSLQVAQPRTRLNVLASGFGIKIPSATFLVIDLLPRSLKGFRRGDSGGPVFDTEGRLLGLAAGRLEKDTQDDTSSFAVVPISGVPQLSEFKSQADGGLGDLTADALPYVGNNGLVPVSVSLAMKFEDESAATGAVTILSSDAGVSAEGGRCAAEIEDQLSSLGSPESSLPPGKFSVACEKAYVALREVELAIREEHRRSTAVLDYAAQIASLNKLFERQLDDTIERWNPPPNYKSSCGAKGCPSIEKFQKNCGSSACATIDALEDSKKKIVFERSVEVWLQKTRKKDARVEAVIKPPEKIAFETAEFTASVGEDVRAVANAQDAQAKKLWTRAVGREPGASEMSGHLLYLTVAPEPEGSPAELLKQAALARAAILGALAKRRQALLDAVRAEHPLPR